MNQAKQPTDRLHFTREFTSGHLAGSAAPTSITYPRCNSDKRLARFQGLERAAVEQKDITGNTYLVRDVWLQRGRA